MSEATMKEAKRIAEEVVRFWDGKAGPSPYDQPSEYRLWVVSNALLFPEEAKPTYILLATEKGLTPVGKLVDALTTFVQAEESFVASVKPGVIDDHLSEAYYKATAALKQFEMYTDNIAVAERVPQPRNIEAKP